MIVGLIFLIVKQHLGQTEMNIYQMSNVLGTTVYTQCSTPTTTLGGRQMKDFFSNQLLSAPFSYIRYKRSLMSIEYISLRGFHINFRRPLNVLAST